jgi:hypothetical protein
LVFLCLLMFQWLLMVLYLKKKNSVICWYEYGLLVGILMTGLNDELSPDQLEVGL